MWTLLLNSTFEPLMVVSWKKALILLMLGKVEVVEEYDRIIRGVGLALRLPAVIRLHRYVRRKTPIVKFSRQNLYFRDRGKCQYCGNPFDHKGLTCDHVVPRSKGDRRIGRMLSVVARRATLRKEKKHLKRLGWL
jgi:5-methylcytosine-specific restriction endonuclease McrA